MYGSPVGVHMLLWRVDEHVCQLVRLLLLLLQAAGSFVR
jgi:hypothetical protein